MTKIDFDKSSEVILGHYLQIQQEEGEDPIVDRHFIKQIYIDDVSGITSDNITKKVMKDRSLYASVFVIDEILGKDGYIFSDARGEKLTDSRVDQYVKEVEAQNKKDFKNPPSQEKLENIALKKMKADGFETTTGSGKFSFINSFILPLVFLIVAAGMLLAVVRRIKK